MKLVLLIVAIVLFSLLAAVLDAMFAARREIKRLKRHPKPEQAAGFEISFEVSPKEKL